MSEGYECDRCGSLNSGTPDTMLQIGDGIPRSRDHYNERHEVYEGVELVDRTYDVCPGCKSEFESWWKPEDNDE